MTPETSLPAPDRVTEADVARVADGAGGKISLGNFQDEESAARAYDKAARDLHGEFAVLNFKEGL